MSSEEIGLTESDLSRLEAIEDNPTKDPGVLVTDPADEPPDWDLWRGKVTKSLSEEITEYAREYSNKEAAEKYNISEKAVRLHRSGKIKWEDATYIDSSRCAVMRLMAHDGYSYNKIADKFNCSTGTVSNHVSASGEYQNCTHDIRIERVSYD